MSKLYRSEFVKTLHECSRDPFSRTNAANHEGSGFLGYVDMKSVELYLEKVKERWRYLSNYLVVLRKVTSIFSMKYQPSEDGNAFEELEWWHYHYENFLIRLSAVLDQTVKLVSVVYEMDLEEKNRKYPRVKQKLKGSTVLPKLENFFEFLKGVRTQRHKIVHKGGYSSGDVQNIMLYKYDEIEIDFFGQEWFDDMNVKKEDEKKKLQKLMEDRITCTEGHIGKVFDSLVTELKQRIEVKRQN